MINLKAIGLLLRFLVEVLIIVLLLGLVGLIPAGLLFLIKAVFTISSWNTGAIWIICFLCNCFFIPACIAKYLDLLGDVELQENKRLEQEKVKKRKEDQILTEAGIPDILKNYNEF